MAICKGVMSQKGAHIGVVKEERTGIIVFVHVSSLMPTNISVPTMCVLHNPFFRAMGMIYKT